jgi:hypothetical protein
MFKFSGDEGLLPLGNRPTGRGKYIFYSPMDYRVIKASGRQEYHGPTNEYQPEQAA